jgi:hypothetical protein
MQFKAARLFRASVAVFADEPEEIPGGDARKNPAYKQSC